MGNAAVDLSAGLIPKPKAIDLSAGFVTRTQPEVSYAQPATSPDATPPERPGLFRRLGQSLGIPTSKEEMAGFISDTVQHPDELFDAPGGMVKKMLRGYGDQVSSNYQDYKDDLRGIASDLSAGRNTTTTALQRMGTSATLQAVKDLPIVGSTLFNYGSDIQQGNYRGAAGSGLGLVAQTVGPEAIKEIPHVMPRIATSADLGAKASATGRLLGREVTGRVPVLNRFESFRKPTFEEYGDAFKAKADPQLSLFNSTPKLRDSPLFGTAAPDVQPAEAGIAAELRAAASRAADLPEGSQPGAEPIKQTVNAPLIAGPPPVSANLEIPRTNSGEGVLNQALTALDNKSLLKVARSRGIDVTKEAQLKAGKADATVVRKILDSFSEDELDEARNIGIEVSRNRPVQAEGITPEAGKEAWHYKVLNTFFPDVSIPKSMAARAQATIGKRPGVMMNAAEKSAIEQANAAGQPTLPPDEPPTPGLMAKAKKRSGGGSAPAQATPAAQQPPVQPADMQPQLATEANTEDLLRKSLEMQQAKKGPGLMANVQKEAPVENRGQYPDLRAEVDKMSPEDRHRAIFISDKTELPNRRAFDIAEGHGQVKAYAMSDADGLKALNDKFGYGAGDALLKAKADALREAGLEAYHDKGDEFLYRGESAADLKAKLDAANDTLKNKVIQVETGDGKVLKFKGAEFSHGEAENLGTAEAGLKTDKAAREAAGKRKRGELGGIKKID